MKRPPMKALASGISAALALVLAVGASAQTPPTEKSPQAAPTTGHPMHGAADAQHKGAQHMGDMKAECRAMMAKKQEMQGKVQAMDATLDELVAKMNAAKTSKKADAMEKPMAAVLTELVAQRKTMRAMMMEMQPEMLAHMGRHRDMQMHSDEGGMGCPMMETGMAHETEETKP